MTDRRIYTLAELVAEKVKGELLLRGDDGRLWHAFQCHGCQTCFEYDADADTIEQLFPHLLRADLVEPMRPGPLHLNCGECDAEFPCYWRNEHCIRFVPD